MGVGALARGARRASLEFQVRGLFRLSPAFLRSIPWPLRPIPAHPHRVGPRPPFCPSVWFPLASRQWQSRKPASRLGSQEAPSHAPHPPAHSHAHTHGTPQAARHMAPLCLHNGGLVRAPFWVWALCVWGAGRSFLSHTSVCLQPLRPDFFISLLPLPGRILMPLPCCISYFIK